MIVYAVFKDGVYRHECYGIFDTESEAKSGAEFAAKNDIDDYHTYEVLPFTMNFANGGREQLPVFSVRKNSEQSGKTQ